jgi:hypothetical protein
VKSKQTDRPSALPLIASGALWAGALLIAVFLPLAGPLTLTTAGVLAWHQSQARARRRLLAALDAYAERQISRADAR